MSDANFKRAEKINEKAEKIQDKASAIQDKAKWLLLAVIPFLLVLLYILIWG